MTATYQIYALKYGERETKEGQFFFREASQKRSPCIFSSGSSSAARIPSWWTRAARSPTPASRSCAPS